MMITALATWVAVNAAFVAVRCFLPPVDGGSENT
jgi:hypothetical protein